MQHVRAVLGGLLGRHLQQLPVQDEAEHVVTSDVRGIVSFLLLYIKALLETFLVLGVGAMEIEGVRDDGSRGGGVLQDLHHDHPLESGRVLNETQPSSTLSSSGTRNLHFICFSDSHPLYVFRWFHARPPLTRLSPVSYSGGAP